MDSVKIAHLSDVHLGAKFSYLDNVNARTRRVELLSAFLRSVSYCEKNDVQILLIAGDLFDNNNIDEETIVTIKKAFATIPNTHIFLTLGNHDFMSDEILRNYMSFDNLHIFPSSWECVHIDDLNVNVYGRSFEASHHDRSFLDDFTLKVPANTINIMLMHADVVSVGSKSLYNPVTEKQLLEAHMDYIALGHIHKQSKLKKDVLPYYVYSGSIEGLGFDEFGQKGMFVANISKRACRLKFVKLCKREFRKITANVTDLETNEDICQKIIKVLSTNPKIYSDSWNKNFYKFILTGKSDINIDTQIIQSKLEESIFCCRVQNDVIPNFDINLLAKENNATGAFARNMLKFYEKNGESEMAKKAFVVGLNALSGKEIKSGH